MVDFPEINDKDQVVGGSREGVPSRAKTLFSPTSGGAETQNKTKQFLSKFFKSHISSVIK